MKPLNYDNSPCSPTSSNCVIWQGPDLDCIKLCKGDTISDVIASLATELCNVMDQLSITNYDLSCFNLVGCKPETYQELLQFLIEQICSLQGLSPTDTTGKTDDVLITVAPCFIVNGITVMSLTDYVTAIGLRICSIIDQITLINNTLNELIIRVTDLENAVPYVYTLPSITVDCTLQDSPLVNAGTPAEPYQKIDQILSILINDDTYGYCALRSATGLPVDLNAAVLSQCILNSDIQLSSSTGATWSTNPNWDQTPTTVANTINNIWLAICDIYDYLKNIITVQDTNTVNLTLTSSNILSAAVQDTGWHDLLGFGYMSGFTTTKPQCRRIGNEIIFRGVIQIPMGDSLDGAGGTVLTASGPDAYSGTAYGKVLDVDTSPSPDACLMYSSGLPVVPSTSPGVNKNEGVSIWFRQGLRVIPTSVLPVTINLDNTYTNGNRQFVNRAINITESAFGVVLATHIGLAVSTTGQLYITSPYSVENYTGTGLQNSSILRSVVSNIMRGENIPLYTNTAPSNSNAPGTIAYNADINASSFTWPFNMNCNNAYEMGGFSVRIDGLKSYIDPCGTLIPTPTPCAIP